MHDVHTFLLIAARHLRRPQRSSLSLGFEGPIRTDKRRSSSTFATFDSLRCDAIYFRGELPLEHQLSECWIDDLAWATCGPIRYEEIAHILIPRFFTQEIFTESPGAGGAPEWKFCDEWTHEQDIAGLSRLLDEAAVAHGLSNDFLEVRRF